MATAVQKITLSSSRDIPFNRLVLMVSVTCAVIWPGRSGRDDGSCRPQ